ncbi:MBL fold metallo-hydrolase [Actinospongicola halichondriae]|uniref:MBL fold metallo-hydrolase n=1 Tax=Actinospongicola halichondriae TaxID=3236844 RepID=UPI003D3F6DA9
MTEDVEEDLPKPIVHEVASALSPYIRRIVANNPGAMTGPGTNTYLVGIDEIAVIDPGPDSAEHLDAIAGCGGDRIRWILLTHTHPDHAPGAAALRKRTGAEICAFDDRDDIPVDRTLADGDFIEATEFRIRTIHTPGHASNHLCYFLEEERTLFSGDHIMQGSTVVIAPPDGDMAAYLESLEKVRIKRLKAIAPGHGHFITEPIAAIDEYVAHRLEREAQVRAAVENAGTTTIDEIVAQLYPGLIDELVPRAAQSVHAHLLKLAGEGAVSGADADGDWSA